MGKWLDLGLTIDETIDHMETLGIRRGLAETILLVEQGKITSSVVEESRPENALKRLYDKDDENPEKDSNVPDKYYIGRNIENEIVAVLGLFDRLTRYSEGIADAVRISEHRFEEEMSTLAESVREAEFIEVKWLLTKDHTVGYATQMMVQAFRHAGNKDAGLILMFPSRAQDFFKRFNPVMLGNRMAVWTPAKVAALAQETKAGFLSEDDLEAEEGDKFVWGIDQLDIDEDEGAPATGTVAEEKSLTQREDLSEVMIGGKIDEELPDYEIEGGVYAEPIDWKLLPRNWASKITIEEGQDYISEDDQRVLDERDPTKTGQVDGFFTPFIDRHTSPTEEDGANLEKRGLLTEVRKSLGDLIGEITKAVKGS